MFMRLRSVIIFFKLKKYFAESMIGVELEIFKAIISRQVHKSMGCRYMLKNAMTLKGAKAKGKAFVLFELCA